MGCTRQTTMFNLVSCVLSVKWLTSTFGIRLNWTVLHRSPLQGHQLRVIDLIVDGRGERKGLDVIESASYVVLDDATVDILSAI